MTNSGGLVAYGEHEVFARGLGKWSDPDVPRSGWSIARIFDLGKGNYQVCEMCETIRIRFVHLMKHEIGLSLESGCICAGHMAEDVAAARMRDDDIQRAADRVGRRLKTLTKAKAKLSSLYVGDLARSLTIEDQITAVKRLYSLAVRRFEGAKKDAEAYDCYQMEVQPHCDFLQELDIALAAAVERLDKFLVVRKQQELQRSLNALVWRPTPKGYRCTTVHGDKAQVFLKDNRYRAMYELAGREPIWSKRNFASVKEAQELVLAVMTRALHKEKRL